MATVLLVMKRPGNIRVLKEALETIGHTAISAPNHDSLAAALAQSDGCRLGLVDFSDLGPADWSMCQTLQSHKVRFIVLAAPHETRKGGQALLDGAASFLQKPVKKPVLLQLLSGLAGETSAIQPQGV